MWRLKSDGSLTQNIAPLPQEAEVIRFGEHGDGRGFSEATLLRRMLPDAFIVATGESLIPDQARMTFQSGVDEILLDDAQLSRYGTEAWQQALDNAVTALYAARSVSRLGGVAKEFLWHKTDGQSF